MCDTDTANLPINQRIKLIREALKLNQRDFSTYLSLSKGYIGGVEAGITKVNGRLVKLIASEFGVNEEWLTTGTGQMFTRKDDAKFTRLVSLFR
ncbi:MAG: helix-turn-helix transcriptional regulator, partial [Treponema sp.]|nr:helix-turn-helix transcriptional regulator [Treponema sp.]